MSLERNSSAEESKEPRHDEEYYLKEIQNGMALKDVPEALNAVHRLPERADIFLPLVANDGVPIAPFPKVLI